MSYPKEHLCQKCQLEELVKENKVLSSEDKKLEYGALGDGTPEVKTTLTPEEELASKMIQDKAFAHQWFHAKRDSILQSNPTEEQIRKYNQEQSEVYNNWLEAVEKHGAQYGALGKNQDDDDEDEYCTCGLNHYQIPIAKDLAPHEVDLAKKLTNLIISKEQEKEEKYNKLTM